MSIRPRASAMKSLQARQLLLPSPALQSHLSSKVVCMETTDSEACAGATAECSSPASALTLDCAHQEVGAAISSALSQGKVEAEQACYLPVSGDSTPVIGKLPGVEGCYMASGAACIACAHVLICLNILQAIHTYL